MADLYVCPRCGETEDCPCHTLAESCDAIRKARKKMYSDLGHLLAVLIERMPNLCPSCEEAKSKGNTAAACKLCSGVMYAKQQVAEARRA